MKKLLVLGLCVTFLAMSSLAFSEDVFVTKRGKKYHQETCRLIKRGKVTTLDELGATEKGYTPCKRCFKQKVLGAKADKENKKGNVTKIENTKADQ